LFRYLKLLKEGGLIKQPKKGVWRLDFDPKDVDLLFRMFPYLEIYFNVIDLKGKMDFEGLCEETLSREAFEELKPALYELHLRQILFHIRSSFLRALIYHLDSSDLEEENKKITELFEVIQDLMKIMKKYFEVDLKDKEAILNSILVEELRKSFSESDKFEDTLSELYQKEKIGDVETKRIIGYLVKEFLKLSKPQSQPF